MACICPVCGGRRWLFVHPNEDITERIAQIAECRRLSVRTGDLAVIRAIPTCPAHTCPGPERATP